MSESFEEKRMSIEEKIRKVEERRVLSKAKVEKQEKEVKQYKQDAARKILFRK